MSRLSIVIPVYYNADTLELLYEDLREKVLGKLEDYEIVMVNDGSGDESWQVIQKLAGADPRIVAVSLSRNFGEHAAIMAGLSVCTGDCAVTKQADLQEDSALILEMLESWKKGNKVVLAIRESRDEGLLKRMFAGLYYRMVRAVVNKDMPKGGCDCYLVDRKVIEVLKLMEEKNSSLTLQVMWTGFKTDMVYFHRLDRKIGKSRWTLGKKIKLVVDSLMAFTYLPVRMMSMTGVLLSIGALVGIILTVVEKLTVGTPILGYASLMSFMLFGFGVTFLMLGVIGEYVWRALEESRTRPPFIIDEVIRQGTDNETPDQESLKEKNNG